MKLVSIVSLTLLLAGCASSPERQLTSGVFAHASVDAELRLELRKDGSYEEYFLNWSAMHAAPNDGFIVPAEPRGRGSWHLDRSKIILSPVSGPARYLRISAENGHLILKENRRSYRLIPSEDNAATRPPS